MMMDSAADPSDNSGQGRAEAPRASEWLWRPWYAKLWWALTLLYWLGLEGLMLVPADHPIFRWFGLIEFGVLIFNPLTVLAVLGRGYMRAKVARGDWVVTSGSISEFEDWKQRERRSAETNPADSRSGLLYLRHIGAIKD
ncbi:hypothetical protein [Sphingomonas lycopersici]|uniref:Uncharacterized protein n=1 Tax=Sphingomonas lycopersici TaxID=2951807 RepID=A0AA42CQV1_9SPHN|nr:hypothetical protein [Sphingomonas lycopersici]MCW6536060.1 hypothetical protein [Sphingomonas lycopersici]